MHFWLYDVFFYSMFLLLLDTFCSYLWYPASPLDFDCVLYRAISYNNSSRYGMEPNHCVLSEARSSSVSYGRSFLS